jgi:hypothetical protein
MRANLPAKPAAKAGDKTGRDHFSGVCHPHPAFPTAFPINVKGAVASSQIKLNQTKSNHFFWFDAAFSGLLQSSPIKANQG